MVTAEADHRVMKRAATFVLHVFRCVTAGAVVATMFALAACQTPSVLQRNFRDGAGVSYTAMGADQRVVVTSEIGDFSRPGLVDPAYITCTEPSPDVAKALSEATTLALNIAERGNLGLANSQATALAQLAERTGAVQLLRERLYQSCLAYKNGAISGVTYTLLMTRLDDVMITMLLGETAGGAFGRSGATVAATAGGSASAALPVLLEQLGGLDEAVERVVTARAALEEKQKAHQTKENECKTALEGEAAKDAANRRRRDELAACKDADTLAQEATHLSAELKVLTDSLQGQVDSSVSTLGTISNVTAMGGLTPRPDPEIAGIIERMQDNFLSGDVTASVIPACLVELGLETTGPPTAVAVYEQALGQLNVAQLRADRLDQQLSASGDRASAQLRTEQRQADAELTRAKDQLEALTRALTAAISGGSMASTDGQYQTIFTAVLGAWGSLGTRDKFDNLVRLAEAAAATRRSSLASYCVTHLPSLVEQLGRNAQSLRQNRLKYDTEVSLARTQAAEADAMARMYRAFSEAFALCDKLPDADRNACRTSILPPSAAGAATVEVRVAREE